MKASTAPRFPVALIVWAALMLLALRTDRRLARIERALDAAESGSTDRTSIR